MNTNGCSRERVASGIIVELINNVREVGCEDLGILHHHKREHMTTADLQVKNLVFLMRQPGGGIKTKGITLLSVLQDFNPGWKQEKGREEVTH